VKKRLINKSKKEEGSSKREGRKGRDLHFEPTAGEGGEVWWQESHTEVSKSGGGVRKLDGKDQGKKQRTAPEYKISLRENKNRRCR